MPPQRKHDAGPPEAAAIEASSRDSVQSGVQCMNSPLLMIIAKAYQLSY